MIKESIHSLEQPQTGLSECHFISAMVYPLLPAIKFNSLRYSKKVLQPKYLIDVATLMGAIVKSLGYNISDTALDRGELQASWRPTPLLTQCLCNAYAMLMQYNFHHYK